MKQTPYELGYHFPAEWEEHRATWLSWPHNPDTWPDKIDTVFPVYAEFVKAISAGERVCINVGNERMQEQAANWLDKVGTDFSQIDFYLHPTNDAWCRDHGPAFLINSEANPKKIIVKWNYNAWGEKYPPYDLDNQIPIKVGKELDIPVFYPNIVMEGGSVDFNGDGSVLTTTACLLNPNRNPDFNQKELEKYLRNFYGVEQVLWLHDGIVGDDTDGHIDDITRFVKNDTIVTVVEEDTTDENFEPLRKNLKTLHQMRLINGKQMHIVELPMPAPVIYRGQRLPASYANFYICNNAVIVPVFQDRNDQRAIETLELCFPDRKVIGINSKDIIWGLGSFHCLSQQEPVV